MRLHVEIPPTAVDGVAPQPPPPLPCLTDACDPAGRPRFGIPIPWLHAGLSQAGTAADPKVLTLAILYALTVSRIVQTGPGVPDVVRTEQQALAAALNHAAWRLLYGEDAGERRADLVQAIRKLFQAWCQALLYPGPRCECGCDPHGVIVGCALVEGGTIRSVDPWGGRRWVVHYPLLSYWGKQFGLQPLDALASKFFDLICCVAHLYPSRDGVILTGVPPVDRAAAPGRSAVVPLGGAVLIFDEPANVAKRLEELGIAVTGSQALAPAAFIGRVVAGLPTLGTGVPGGALVHYTVEGVPELHLIAAPDGSSNDGGTPR